MIITKEILYIMLAALIVCLVGFRKYIWFVPIVYGLSISAIALMLLLLFGAVFLRLRSSTTTSCESGGLFFAKFIRLRYKEADKSSTALYDEAGLIMNGKILNVSVDESLRQVAK